MTPREKGRLNYPFGEVVEDARKHVGMGNWVFQKFSCQKCANRLTMDVANKFHTHGTCDKCGATTDIEKDGCNYLIMAGRKDPETLEAVGLKPPEKPGITVSRWAGGVDP